MGSFDLHSHADRDRESVPKARDALAQGNARATPWETGMQKCHRPEGPGYAGEVDGSAALQAADIPSHPHPGPAAWAKEEPALRAS